MFVDCHLPKNHSFLWIPYLFLHWHHKTSCFVKPFFLEMLFFLKKVEVGAHMTVCVFFWNKYFKLLEVEKI
jgi:hypothetical protein